MWRINSHGTSNVDTAQIFQSCSCAFRAHWQANMCARRRGTANLVRKAQLDYLMYNKRDPSLEHCRTVHDIQGTDRSWSPAGASCHPSAKDQAYLPDVRSIESYKLNGDRTYIPPTSSTYTAFNHGVYARLTSGVAYIMIRPTCTHSSS